MIDESQGSFIHHAKLFLFFCFLILIDTFILYRFYIFHLEQPESHSKLIIILYAFEFFLLFTKALLPFLKYLINLLEIATFSHFESKLTIFSVLDFVFTSMKLIIQLGLLEFIRRKLGLPLHLVAETIETIFGLINTLKNFINSCILTYRLNRYFLVFKKKKKKKKKNRLEDIDEKGLKNQDTTCLICLQEIKLGKRISCGHVFHLSCLKLNFFIFPFKNSI